MNATLFGNWVFYTYNQVKIRSYSIGGTQVQYDWYLLTKGEETGPERRTPCKDEDRWSHAAAIKRCQQAQHEMRKILPRSFKERVALLTLILAL